MSVPAEKYVAYYRGILKRIVDGWKSPGSLASIALVWKLHESGCAFHSGDFGKCTCSTNDARAKPTGASIDRIAVLEEALKPFAEIGAFMFARNLPDETPVVEIKVLNGATYFTRGDFKRAHIAVYPDAHPSSAEPSGTSNDGGGQHGG